MHTEVVDIRIITTCRFYEVGACRLNFAKQPKIMMGS